MIAPCAGGRSLSAVSRAPRGITHCAPEPLAERLMLIRGGAFTSSSTASLIRRQISSEVGQCRYGPNRAGAGNGVPHRRTARPHRRHDQHAGVFPRIHFLEMTEVDWDHVLDVNLKGSCFCAQAVARAMITAGRRGSIRRRTARLASGRALCCEQGRRAVADPGDGTGARPLPHQGQRDRARAHRYGPAALRQQ